MWWVPDWVAPDAFERLYMGELTLIFDKACELPPTSIMGYDPLVIACKGDIFVGLDKVVADISDSVDLIIDLGGDTLDANSDSTVKANTIVDFTFEQSHQVRIGVFRSAASRRSFPP